MPDAADSIAFISDLHGNLVTLDAVLPALERDGIERVVCRDARTRAGARARLAGTADPLDKHGDDVDQELAATRVSRSIGQAGSLTHVQDYGAFGRRALGRAARARLFAARELPSTLGDVERHRSRGSLELVGEIGTTPR
jgi:hypothetical protein